VKRPAALEFLGPALAELEKAGLLRIPAEPPSAGARSFCSNDYLGLAGRRAPPEELGASASRLVAGERAVHRALERAVAEWLEAADALVFVSGYSANVGALAALARPGDLVVSDALNHASIVDGARLSRANVHVVPHLDLGAVARALAEPRQGRAWVVVESYYSMDADSPNLDALRAVCDRAGAGLVVDEAHALGVLGPDGRGLCAAAEVVPDALVGTFGKAFGAGGAFVAGCAELRSWLWNRARSFVFSTGLSPALAAGAHSALGQARTSPALRQAVNERARHFRAGLHKLGITPLGYGHIVPWVLGEPARAVAAAGALRKRGIHVQAIRPPSVPRGTARLRFTVTACHSAADIDAALGAVEEALRCDLP
jgi:8-amino-7-oxononanoate synthase